MDSAKNSKGSLFSFSQFTKLSEQFCMEQADSTVIEALILDHRHLLEKNPFFQDHDLFCLKLAHYDSKTMLRFIFHFYYDENKQFTKMFFFVIDQHQKQISSLSELEALREQFSKLFSKIEFGMDKVVLEIDPLLKTASFRLVNCTFMSEYTDLRMERPSLTLAVALHLKVFGIYLELTNEKAEEKADEEEN